MGSISDISHNHYRPEHECVHVSATGQAISHDYKSFEVAGLVSSQIANWTCMRDEILLLSWLLVLLRTQEGSQVCFDWAYQGQDQQENAAAYQCLSMHEIISSLQCSVEETAAAVHSHIMMTQTKDMASSRNPVLLVLSTGCMSQPSEDAKVEGTLYLELRWTTCLEIRSLWHTKNMPQHTVTRYVETLVDSIRICIASPKASIEECIRPTAHDLDEIWRLNHSLPPSHKFCMHDMISEKARKYQDKVAISSWDGDLTFTEIDQWSTSVARSLIESGIKLHDVLPVCFEKSKWTIVALLAVMKAGATFVLMDPTLPLARLQNIATQVDAKSILTSRQQHDLSTSIVPGGTIFIVESGTFTGMLASHTVTKLPTVAPSALMYIIFTSGSTGVPKGVMISHETYTSSAIPRAKAVGYTEESRVLDFASYAFDVSIDSMLLTVSQGGCLCIPSDEDRVNDLNGVIRGMQINYAGLTPSVARILDEDVTSSLSSLGLGGEAVTARDVSRWGRDTRIVIGYGPCECTIGCTINSSAATGKDYISIGQGNGAAIWVVDPNDHESLMPIGAVGELLVEGPIVGQGYLNDPAKTAESFINDPPWLVAGHRNYPGRHGRLYKTGDLVKYDPDGSGGFVFVGRKDTQVKLRGQRVELGEIEWQLRTRLPPDTGVVAEVIAPANSGGQHALVAFIALQSMNNQESSDLELVQISDELWEIVSKADGDLAEVLPRYMVPTACIPVNYIPALISGKTDRKRLRQFGATVDIRQLEQGKKGPESTATGEMSDVEQRVRQAWSHTLGLDTNSIRAQDNFFALGGDSVKAMRLVSVCREQGLDTTVANIFTHPILSNLATVMTDYKLLELTETPPFSLISYPVDDLVLKASDACSTSPDNIEDIYPCTPTQESLFTFSIKSATPYVAQRLARIPEHVSLNNWKMAWEGTVRASPILRTRIIQSQNSGLQQVVLKETVSWRYSDNLSRYLEEDQNDKMDLGHSLARYAIIEQPNDSARYMVWTIHHVVYDGWSEPLILKKISNALQDQQFEVQAQMKDFVKHVRSQDEMALQDFWREELKGATGPQFPSLPFRDYMPTPESMLEHEIPLETVTGLPFTIATIIRGAWSLVASQYTGSDDVVLSETLTGRDVSLLGIESIEGPLITTLPVRVRINRVSTTQNYLQSIQQGISARAPHEHYGIQNIRRVSRDAQHACEARTGLVIQPEVRYSGNDLGFERKDALHEALHFNPYPLMLACGIHSKGIRVCASFDSGIIDSAQMRRVLRQLEKCLLHMIENLSRCVNEVSCLPQTELNQIWQWNRTPPLSTDGISNSLRANTDVKQGSIYPPAVVSWVCNPRNSFLLSPIGCVGELWIEGNFLTVTGNEPPPWLVAGSSKCPGRFGKVQSTGDLVQLGEDGSLIFVGRKENISEVQGHAINLADVEAQCARKLPSTTRAAAAIMQLSIDEAQETSQQEVVVFIERCSSDQDEISLLPAEFKIQPNDSDAHNIRMSINTSVSLEFAEKLKELDKSIQDSLPPYMVPSAYIMVDQILIEAVQVDRNQLNKAASKIPRQILEQVRRSLRDAWTANSAQKGVTVAEKILRSSWAEVLKLNSELIELDDNFFRLGGDSVMAMKLVSNLRMQGHVLTIADIFQHMRLRDAATVLKVTQVSDVKLRSYDSFSTLKHLDIKVFLSGVVRPQLVNQSWSIQDVLPVTDAQTLDVRATLRAPRTSVQYNIMYFQNEINREQLFHACNELVKAHDILRTVFVEHESTFFQVVLHRIDVTVAEHRTEKEIDLYVSDLCTADTESDWKLGSAFVKMFYVVDHLGKECLIIGLSHALYDGTSLPMLLLDLETLYRGDKTVDSAPFNSYMAQISNSNNQTKALDYWRKLLDGSSLSVLAVTPKNITEKSIFQAKSVDVSKRPKEITMANLLSAAWALIVARSLQSSDVTFGSVSSGRHIDLANVENVVGPCYQFIPIRVSFKPQWTGIDLLQFVQNQGAESAAHDFLGFEKISTECTQWPSEAGSLDSIVHHQDFEDFDAMPFAGGTCRVEILNPHGDAAYPLKVVSFVQDGRMHVGVVGSERDPGFVDATLDELVLTVERLANRSSEEFSVFNQGSRGVDFPSQL